MVMLLAQNARVCLCYSMNTQTILVQQVALLLTETITKQDKTNTTAVLANGHYIMRARFVGVRACRRNIY